MMDIARMILSELTLRKLPKIPSFSAHLAAHLGKIYWEAYKACRRQWDAEDLERIQTKRLRAMVKHAYEHVLFYHKQFDSIGIKPGDIKNREDLKKLPTLSKQDIRIHFPELIPYYFELGKCSCSRTSGSTGEPTIVLKNVSSSIHNAASTLRQHLACGVKFGTTMLYIVPSSPSPHPSLNYLGFHKVYSFSFIQPERDKEFVSVLKKLNPTTIYGATSLIKAFADFVLHEKLSEIRPKVIITSYELLDEMTRQYLTDVFGAEIIDAYGCSEVGNIAWECQKHEGYHIDTDNVIVEVIEHDKVDNKDGRGEIVVTDLNNYVMPLIRYRTGDIGVFASNVCSCGRKLPLLEKVEGRAIDFVLSPTREVISPYELMGVIHNSTMSISQYQIIQKNRNLLIIKIVEDIGFTSDMRDDIESRFKRIVGNQMEVRLISVDAISREKSGKLRPVICEISDTNEIMKGK